jgi:hypothetical protein
MTRVTKEYVPSIGCTIKVEELETLSRKSKRKQFKLEWVKFPLSWFSRLQHSRRVEAYRLAFIILREVFKCQVGGGEIILSTEVTRMKRSTKLKAARELARLGLIKIIRDGNKALRVVPLLSTIIEKKE